MRTRNNRRIRIIWENTSHPIEDFTAVAMFAIPCIAFICLLIFAR